MAQPKNKNYKNGVLIGFWVDPELKKKLVARAKRQERTLSGFIRFLLAREVEP